jgi:hypothetical protein
MKHEPRVWKTSEVFVAGELPTVTYNPRDEQRLEQDVKEYREQFGKALTVFGPSKSGKTVLIERLFPRGSAVWVQGSDLNSVDGFWKRIADGLELFDRITVRGEQTTTADDEYGFSIGPKGATANQSSRDSSALAKAKEAARERPLPDLVREAMRVEPWPVVIDDFQYVPANLKRAIARAVKTLIPDTHVVLAAVPHSAFDAVLAEPDMNGRVWQLEVEPWSVEELMFIAREGFKALGILDTEQRIGKVLAEASYGAPFLMQQVCYDYARSLGVTRTSNPRVRAEAPDWHDFFRRVAERSRPGIFAQLLEGPAARGTARTPRHFKVVDVTTDIYGAVLYGVAKVGPEHPIRHQDITRIIDESFHEPLRPNQVTNALGHMSDIAEKHRGSSDPALVFRAGRVYVMDPFFAFYLEYGSWIS